MLWFDVSWSAELMSRVEASRPLLLLLLLAAVPAPICSRLLAYERREREREREREGERREKKEDGA